MTPLGLTVASTLRRFDASLVDQAQVDAALEAIPGQGGPEYQGLARLAVARWRLLDAPGQAIHLLEQALAAAPAANAVERPLVESGARQELAFEAARNGRWVDSLEWLRGAADVAMPGGCVLGVAVDVERQLLIARRRGGAIAGSYTRQAAVHGRGFNHGTGQPPVVPAALLDLLSGCDEVEVIAQGRQRNWSRLLPLEVPWSYAARPPSRAEATASGGRSGAKPLPKRLIISDARPPPSLLLSRLAPVQLSSAAGVTSLRGPEASPANVLARLPEADLVEFHVHGMVDADVSQDTALVLSPDSRGDFLLTRADLHDLVLPRRPVVILAACDAAKLATRRPDTNELATAFMRAGGRSVIASTGPIPDGQGEAFFARLRSELDRGVPVSRALRNARIAWPRQGRRSWTDHILIYQ